MTINEFGQSTSNWFHEVGEEMKMLGNTEMEIVLFWSANNLRLNREHNYEFF